MFTDSSKLAPIVGVGLRYEHYEQALSSKANIDFVEVHTENFYVEGGATAAVLERARELYEVSLHCTSLGLGSAEKLPQQPINKLSSLIQRIEPALVSDHLSFAWGKLGSRNVHLGDLLPIQRDQKNLSVLSNNIDRVQQAIGRPLLIENISSYISGLEHAIPETEFLTLLVERTGCRLLVDINNLAVNAHNALSTQPVAEIHSWLDAIPADAVGEIHLAGFTAVAKGETAIDDHSQPVSPQVWQGYEYAIQRFGITPTLIEWDTQLPDWKTLLEQADYARTICQQRLSENSIP